MTTSLILFANDWERINAQPHIDTKNTSFLHLARLLKTMGVKNHMFFLALVNQDLKRVNPFAPDISDEEIGMVLDEVFINPWYFFREIARAPGQAGAPARQLEGNRGNISLFWSFFNHVMTLLIQIRQTGKSFNSDILATGLLNIWCRGTQINLLTKDEKLRRANIQRLKDIMGVLPRYIDQRTRADADNTEIITVKSRDNYYYTHLPQASEALAGNVGRGLTSPIFFCDEPPFQANIHEALPAALAAGGAARELAEAAGAPFGTVLTTTAGKKDTKEGAFMHRLMSGMAQWSDSFYDARDQAHLYEMIKANSRDREIRVNITLNHRQMGKDDEWLKRKISDSVATGDKADRDFFNRWTAGTATNPLSIKTLEKIRQSEREPLYQEIAETGGYITKWYIPAHEIEVRMSNEETIVVFDTSEASGGDDISMRVTSVKTGKCYASGTYNNTNIITFSEWVSSWLTRWSKTTMLIERRSTGSSVIDMLLLILPSKDIDPFKRLFNRIVNSPDEHKEAWAIVKEPVWRRPTDFLELNKRYFGFPTSGSGTFSRGSLYGQVLHSAASTVGHLVTDKITIDQIASLITKNGRVNHPAGEHDDMVISWVLSHWFLTKATNLSFYGIDATTILQSVKEVSELSPLEQHKAKHQNNLRNRARDITAEIKETKDEALIRMMEQELRLIYSRMEVQDNEKLSVDELITSLREERQRKRMLGHGQMPPTRPPVTNAPTPHQPQTGGYRANLRAANPVNAIGNGAYPFSSRYFR